MRALVFRSGFLLLLFQVRTSQAEEQSVRIVTLGDSITQGVRVKPEETFSALLETSLKMKGIRGEVANSGVGFERTDLALLRIEKDVIARKPHLVTIMYGTNDSYIDRGKTESRLPLEEYRANLVKIVDKLEAAGIRPVLMTEPRWGPRGANGVGESPNRLLEKYVAACREVAKQRQLLLIDHYADWSQAEARGVDLSDWMAADQCHPNPDGHRRMMELMLPVIERAAKRD